MSCTGGCGAKKAASNNNFKNQKKTQSKVEPLELEGEEGKFYIPILGK